MNWGTKLKGAFLLLALLLPGYLYASDSKDVGQVIFIAGGVSALNGDETRPLLKGGKVRVGDTLITAQDGHLHVRFVDGALISVRPQSRALIDTYDFDPENLAASRVKINLEEGVLRSATGKAGQENKEGFRINTPVAAIGIRGTDFVVFSDDTRARIAVNAGGVVAAPFGEGCQTSGFAPCGGASSAELFSSISKALLEVRAGQSHALVTNEGPAPDDIIPPHPDEASLFEILVSGSMRTSQLREGLSAPGAETYEEGLENAQRYLRNETLVQQAYALGAQESDIPQPNNLNLVDNPEFIWGRWGPYGRSLGQLSLATATESREQVRLSSVFVMFERQHDERPLPEVGSATFKLNSYESYIKRGNALETAGISNPALIVDFDQSRFATRLDVHAASLPGVVSVLGAGELTRDGFFQSDRDSPSKIEGVLSPHALEAGFLFEHQVETGVQAIGATHWVNRQGLSLP